MRLFFFPSLLGLDRAQLHWPRRQSSAANMEKIREIWDEWEWSSFSSQHSLFSRALRLTRYLRPLDQATDRAHSVRSGRAWHVRKLVRQPGAGRPAGECTRRTSRTSSRRRTGLCAPAKICRPLGSLVVRPGPGQPCRRWNEKHRPACGAGGTGAPTAGPSRRLRSGPPPPPCPTASSLAPINSSGKEGKETPRRRRKKREKN